MLRLTSPFKRCKFVRNQTTGISINSGGHNDGLSLPSRCEFVPSETTSISINSGEHNDGLSVISVEQNKVTSQGDSSINSVEPKSELNFVRPIKAQPLEVIPFLSNNGQTKYLVRSNGDKVGFDAVLGKHLGICCVSLPMLEGESYFNSMISAYSELSRDDFEMVLAAHVKPGSDNAETLFNDFFSGLPCLAIPFSEFQTRDNICSFIGFNPGSFFEDATAIVVDPSQMILEHTCSTLIYFYYFGSEWFPFFQSNAEAIRSQIEVLRIRLDPIFYENFFSRQTVYHEKCRRQGRDILAAVMGDPLLRVPLSLHKDILQCDPSLVLPRIGAVSAANQQSLTVSELSNKYVGLYLCANTDLIHDVIKVHRHCLAKEQELVVVVVCVPICHRIDWLQQEIKQSLEKYDITWFILPDNSKVWRLLWRVFGKLCEFDEMVILPPNCKSGELDGRVVIESLGVDGYPFARSSILDQTFTALKSLTPASLFKGTTEESTCLVRNGGKSNVRQCELKGKKLLLYLDWLYFSPNPLHSSKDNGLCSLLMKQYYKIQAMGWEVVFVPLDIEDEGERHAMFAKMPWPIMPLSDAVEASVTGQLFFPGEYRHVQLVAFEEDGRMVSRQVKMRLENDGIKNTLFNDTLYQEIFSHLDILGPYN